MEAQGKEEHGTGPLRVAIAGAGAIADVHLPVLTGGEAVVVGIADPAVEAARRTAARHGLDEGLVAPSLSEVLRRETPDVVHVLAPPATHASLAIEALEAGAHVYVEKPMATDEEACRAVRAAARAAGREVCVGHSLTRDPLFRRARERLDEGGLGELLHAGFQLAFDPKRHPAHGTSGHWSRALPGGLLEDLAAHPLSVLAELIGEPREVARVPESDPEADPYRSELAVTLGGERGLGLLVLSLRARPADAILDVRCTRGGFRLNYSNRTLTFEPERGVPPKVERGLRNVHLAGQLAGQTVTSTARFLLGRLDATGGVHTLIREFHRSLREGRTAPVSAEEGERVVRLLRAVWPREAAGRAAWPTGGRAAWPTGTAGGAPETRGEWPSGGKAPERAPSGDERVPAPETPMRALVTGGTGFVGRHLVRHLLAGGDEVRILARSAERGRALAELGAEVRLGDLRDPGSVRGIADGIGVVYHLASAIVGTWEDFEAVDVEGTRHLLEEAAGAGARRFVYASSVAVYDADAAEEDSVLDESAPVDGTERAGHYGRAKVAAERLVRAAHRDGRLEGVVVRLGLVFGPGRDPLFPETPHFGARVRDWAVVLGEGKRPLPLVYVGDLVEALRRCGTLPEAAGETLNLVDRNVERGEYLERLARLTVDGVRLLPLPRWTAHVIGGGAKVAARVLRREPPTSPERLLAKAKRIGFDGRRAREVLGWEPDAGLEEGLRRTVEAGRSNGA